MLPSVRRFAMRLAVLGTVTLLVPGACNPPSDASRGQGGDAPHRAILLSLDGLNEAIFRGTLEPHEAPALDRLFTEGACAEHAESHFPSVTAASHAVLWTGAWGDVHGVTANTMPLLPRDRHTILETRNGFHYGSLSAEPLWITAGKAGIPVAGHHVTQAPGVPGYPAVRGERTSEQEARRRESEVALAHPGVHVMNGYNRLVLPQQVVRGGDVRWSDAHPWEGAERFGGPRASHPPRAFTWDAGELGTLHGLVVAGGADAAPGAGYDTLLLAQRPEVDAAIRVGFVPPDPEGRGEGEPLARHFPDPLVVEVEEGRAFVHLRLFQLSPQGRDFAFYLPPVHVVEGNRQELTRAYEDAIGGWTGNSGFLVYRNGGFGPRIMEGGDGTAEALYLETAEHLLRHFDAGSRWLWENHGPRLLLDYFPLSDAIDHELLGWLDPERPGFDAALARRVRDFRARVWGLVDRRLETLMALAEESGGTLFVSGDHGMRASWQVFHVNLALAEAGLLALDATGNIDLSRTRAASTHGYFIRVNRTESPEGIVPPEEEAQVVEAVIQALREVRTPSGDPVVTRVFTPATHPELGLGGPAGGDVYWATGPGIRSSGSVRATAPLVEGFLTAGHGFPPDEADMFTVFCAWGPGVAPGRIPAVPTTVVAPTVAEAAGIPRPADAVGASVLRSLLAAGDRR